MFAVRFITSPNSIFVNDLFRVVFTTGTKVSIVKLILKFVLYANGITLSCKLTFKI